MNEHVRIEITSKWKGPAMNDTVAFCIVLVSWITLNQACGEVQVHNGQRTVQYHVTRLHRYIRSLSVMLLSKQVGLAIAQ